MCHPTPIDPSNLLAPIPTAVPEDAAFFGFDPAVPGSSSTHTIPPENFNAESAEERKERRGY